MQQQHQEQLDHQKEQLECQMEHQREQMEHQKEQMAAQQKARQKQMEAVWKAQKEQLEAIMARLSTSRDGAPIMAATSMPSFAPFDPTTELWKDYRARFDTFAGANSIPDGKMAQVFLTNQTPAT